MRFTHIGRVLGIIATVIGIGIGISIATAQGLHLSARAPLAPYKELPELPVAPANLPSAIVGGTVLMTPYGYQPQTLEIRRGEAVEFRNVGIAKQWPHSEDTTLLNAPGIVEPEQSWYAVLPNPGTFTLYDHVYPSATGTIIVR